MAEWLKAADCKSARVAYVGSNPTPTTTVMGGRVDGPIQVGKAIVWVEINRAVVTMCDISPLKVK